MAFGLLVSLLFFCKRRNFEAIEGFLLSSYAVSEECVACVAECLSEQLEMVLCLETCTGSSSTSKARLILLLTATAAAAAVTDSD